jgi:hypothetical protein
MIWSNFEFCVRFSVIFKYGFEKWKHKKSPSLKNGAIFKIYVQIDQKHPFITKRAGSAEPLRGRALRFNDVALPA